MLTFDSLGSNLNVVKNTYVITGCNVFAQVIIVMRVLWLVEDFVMTCYNHPARGGRRTISWRF